MKSVKTIKVNVDPSTLWKVLTQAKFTKEYMFNCEVKSDWEKGHSIVWEGNYEGYEAYQKGEILEVDPSLHLKYSTFDSNFGMEDKPENYIHVTYLLEELDNGTELTIINETFDGDPKRMVHIENGWDMVMERLKDTAERQSRVNSLS